MSVFWCGRLRSYSYLGSDISMSCARPECDSADPVDWHTVSMASMRELDATLWIRSRRGETGPVYSTCNLIRFHYASAVGCWDRPTRGAFRSCLAGAFEFSYAYGDFGNASIVLEFHVTVIHPRGRSARGTGWYAQVRRSIVSFLMSAIALAGCRARSVSGRRLHLRP